jgi:tetratricopeptide (TPR) repeat protein
MTGDVLYRSSEGPNVLAPDNADVLLGTGIYNYYAAVIPETYPWVKPFMLFFPSGDREEGLQQLRTASENARYAGIEAAYFLMQILYFNEKNYGEGYTLAKELTERFPRNPLFKRYYGRFAVGLNRWNTAHEVFTEVKQQFDNGVFGYSLPAGREANYYIGQYLFHRNEYEKALDYYSEVIRISHELDQDSQSGFMILATLRRGMIFDALGERERALQEYRTVRSLDDYQGSRKLAERYIETPYSTGRTVQEINPNRFSP